MTCMVFTETIQKKTPTKAEYKERSFFEALMSDAPRALERVPMPSIGKIGNSKIGTRGVKALCLVYSGTAWHDCFPTSGCDACYAMRFRYLHAAGHRQGKAWLYSYMSRYQIDILRRIIMSEIEQSVSKARLLGIKLAVRIHEAGDFHSIDQVHMWLCIVQDTYTAYGDDVVFWAYTRSDKIDHMREPLQALAKEPQMNLRASFDPAEDLPKELIRNGLPGAIVVGRAHRKIKHGPDRVPGAVNCPEQATNGAMGCADCGLCWHKSKPVIRFWKH